MTETVLDLHTCSARRSLKVTVANTAAAEAAFLDFYARRDTAAREESGRSYGDLAVGVWGRDEAEMTANVGAPFEALSELLWPTCEHGMSAHSCYGPEHFMSYAQERALGL